LGERIRSRKVEISQQQPRDTPSLPFDQADSQLHKRKKNPGPEGREKNETNSGRKLYSKNAVNNVLLIEVSIGVMVVLYFLGWTVHYAYSVTPP